MSLPYIHIPTLPIGPIDIQPFGILLASGVILASWMGRKYAERNGLDEEVFRRLSLRILIVGFIGCHLFNVAFYDHARLLGWDPLFAGVPGTGLPPSRDLPADPLLILKVWDGISSWGGVVAGAACFLWYARSWKLDRLRWADLLSWCGIGGWVPGRAACAVVHDHTGGPTDFALGIAVPDPVPPHTPAVVAKYAGQTIHDLGLYEFLYLIPILVILVLVERIPNRKPGIMMGLLATLYSVPRFFLDTLRPHETDPRYAGLTFAQYCCIVAFIFGAYLLLRPRDVEKPKTA